MQLMKNKYFAIILSLFLCSTTFLSIPMGIAYAGAPADAPVVTDILSKLENPFTVIQGGLTENGIALDATEAAEFANAGVLVDGAAVSMTAAPVILGGIALGGILVGGCLALSDTCSNALNAHVLQPVYNDLTHWAGFNQAFTATTDSKGVHLYSDNIQQFTNSYYNNWLLDRHNSGQFYDSSIPLWTMSFTDSTGHAIKVDVMGDYTSSGWLYWTTKYVDGVNMGSVGTSAYGAMDEWHFQGNSVFIAGCPNPIAALAAGTSVVVTKNFTDLPYPIHPPSADPYTNIQSTTSIFPTSSGSLTAPIVTGVTATGAQVAVVPSVALSTDTAQIGWGIDAVTGTQIGTATATDPGTDTGATPATVGAKRINLAPLIMTGDAFTSKFPFSIPWDFLHEIQQFNITPQVPVFHIDAPHYIKLGGADIPMKFDISFEQFDFVGTIVRWFIIVVFDIGLILGFSRLVVS